MKKTLSAVVTAGMLFAVTAVGASLLDLSGSDTAPGSGKTEAACAGPLIVTNPVTIGGHNNNKIEHVDVAGDMSQCNGQTMLVEVDLYEDTAHAWAVAQLSGASSLTFTFDETTGDFYDTAPSAAGGTLVPTGTMVGPYKDKEFGLVTISIASTWE